MTKRMLIDASHSEETRVVLADNERLLDFEYESIMRKQLRGNIFLAKVTRVEPSLQAAFVNFGGNRHGFLPFSEIHPDYYRVPVADREALLEEQRQAIEEARRLEEEEDAEMEAAENNDNEDDEEDDDDDVAEVGGDNVPAPEDEDSEDSDDDSNDEDNNPETGSGEETDHNNGKQNSRNRNRGGRGRNNRGGRGRHNKGGKGRANHDNRKVEIVGGDHIEGDHPIRPNLTRRYKIQEVIKRGQIMLVQASKEERGNKGAAVTTYLSLPGRYCVLMPNSPRSGGVSRKIASYKDRKRLREILKEFNLPDGMSVIVRTAGVERTKTEIKRDLDYLLRLWDNIRSLTLESQAPSLIYEEGELVKRSIRDVYTRDIDEVLVQGARGYKTAKDMMKMMIPSHAKRVKEYKDQPVSLFQKFKLEEQISGIGNPTVPLKSGGSLVIHPTEALVSIDVNSGRATKERHIEETALRTNMEAAEEVARQLKLRDLGGLVVVDFIDMEDRRNNKKVERKLKDTLSNDRARIQVGRISSFGLLELSRQRISASITEMQFQRCPHCDGVGVVRSTDSMAIVVLRALETEGLNGKAGEVSVNVAPEVALYILNNKRAKLVEIEQSTNMRIFVRSDDNCRPSDYEIETLKTRKQLAKEDGPDDAVVEAGDIEHIQGEQDNNAQEEQQNDNNKGKNRNRRGGRGRGNRGGKNRKNNNQNNDNSGDHQDQTPQAQDKAEDNNNKGDQKPAQNDQPADAASSPQEDQKADGPSKGSKSKSGNHGGKKKTDAATKSDSTDQAPDSPAQDDKGSEESQPKRRGRPPKKKEATSEQTGSNVAETPVKEAASPDTETKTAAATAPSPKAPEKIEQDDASNENDHAKDYEVVNEAPKAKKKGWWNKLVE